MKKAGMKRTSLLILVAIFIVSMSGGWASANYPTRPIQLIVEFAPGGLSDVTARNFVSIINNYLPQPMVVTNIEGAGGNIGRRQVKDATPDGYTLGIHHLALPISYHIGNVEFGIPDLHPIAAIAISELMVFSGANNDWETLDELIAAHKENPGRYRGGLIIGSWAHFAVHGFAEAANIEYHLIHTEGEADRITRLLSGEIDWSAVTIAAAGDYIDSGDLKPLALLADERNPLYPDVPTAKELGVDFSSPGPMVIYSPLGIDPLVEETLVNAIKEAYEDEETSKIIKEKARLRPYLLTGSQLVHYLQSIDKDMHKMAVEFGLKDE